MSEMYKLSMSGFATSGGAGAMTYYDASWIPYYYALANTFVIADHYHARVPSSTRPNHMYMVAGTSLGHIINDPPPPRAEKIRSSINMNSLAKVGPCSPPISNNKV
jgi:phospholipase C